LVERGRAASRTRLTESFAVAPLSVQLVASTETFAIGHWDNVVICMWQTNVTVEQLDQALGTIHALASRHPDGIATFTIMDKSVMLSIPAEVRKKAKAVLDAGDRHVRARALVLAGDGFWASALRSVLIGIGYAQRHQTQVVVSVERAARHLTAALRRPVEWEQQLVFAAQTFQELARSQQDAARAQGQ